MNTARILYLTRHPQLLDRETLYELRNCLSRYPYFTAVRMLYLHNLYLVREPGFKEELKLAALHVNDRSRLFQIIEGHKYTPVAPPAPAVPPKREPLSDLPPTTGRSRTLDLINQFLTHQPEREALVPFDLTVDYTTYLLEENEPRKETTSTEILIDSFLNAAPYPEVTNPKETPPEETEKTEVPEIMTESVHFSPAEEKKSDHLPVLHQEAPNEDLNPLDESFFTETLAKIYIKQGRYDKALEIIKNIYLKNPKKSAYFADQIRFLEKLIINSK